MQKILVTGGAGFIGSHIVDFLIKKDYEVVVVDNLSTGKEKYLNKNVKFYKANIMDPIGFIFKKEKPDIVIHTAAQVQVRKSLKNPIFDAKLNIIGTINILEECRNNNVKKIIYTSTGAARVGEPKYFPVDEKHPIAPCSPYGISKHTAEHYVEMYGKLYDLNYLIFCFGNVYGPRDDPSNDRLIPVFINKMIKEEWPTIFDEGKPTRDFIYVADLASFIVDSINKEPMHRLFHLASGQQISVKKIADYLGKLLNFKKNFKHTKSMKGEIKNIVLDSSLAKKELGWEPKYGIFQGLQETIKFIKKSSV